MLKNDALGWIMIALVAICLSIAAYLAYLADKANGISVDSSLRAWGL